MSHFVKIEGESVWVNVDRVDALIACPQLRALGQAHGQGALEELHEAPGKFEVAIMFAGQFAPVQAYESKEAAESFVHKFLQSLP